MEKKPYLRFFKELNKKSYQISLFTSFSSKTRVLKLRHMNIQNCILKQATQSRILLCQQFHSLAGLTLIYYFKVFMKDRLGYSPKELRPPERFDINFKKSPNKFVQYDSPIQPQDLPVRDNPPYTSNFREFDNLKKVPDEAASLRVTMNSKFLNRLQRNHLLDVEDNKDNKLTDFLRQTMTYKPAKTYSETLIPDYAYSGELYDKDAYKSKNNKNYETYRGQQPRKGIEYIEESKSMQNYDRLHEKINRQTLLIQDLRKAANKNEKEKKDLLKNVNQYKSPSFLQLDHKKQKEDLGFKRPAKEQNNYYLTPKIDKGNYEARFNSSPLIQRSKSREKDRDEPTISNHNSPSSIKRKLSTAIPNKANIIEEFMIDKKLGQGKFGCVNLVRHKKTNSILALKKVPKALIKSNMMIDQLTLEIRIQSCLKNANILEMYGFFDDKTHLYIVLQYMEGGTLYQKLKKQKLRQNEAAIIIRQITLAIDYLHDIGIAHRDIKPQNIVISNNVYKLCDFGWAAICNERRKTYCGTFDYVAPQILQGAQYDMTVDLWCLGVLTYQVLTGKAPFYHISRKQTMKKILNVENQNIVYPQSMSETAKDFIDKLIRKNPEQRIKASEALLHPFLDVKED